MILRGAPWALSVVFLVACSSTSSSDGSGGGGEGGGTSGGTGGGAVTSASSGASTTSTGTGAGGAPGACDGGPLAAPLPNCTLTPLPTTGDAAQDCVDRINQFRWECQCLPPLARWADAEVCTDDQSADDQAADEPHGNFPACGENAQNTCPNWGSEADVVGGCLQMMWDEGPGEPFAEHGHYLNMSSTTFTKVACGFSTSNAGVWANQNFAP